MCNVLWCLARRLLWKHVLPDLGALLLCVAWPGDGARRDKDGYYWIIGRVDDVINVSGHRIGTAEVSETETCLFVTVFEHLCCCCACCCSVDARCAHMLS